MLKLNNKGWGFREMMLLVIIIVFALFIVVYLIQTFLTGGRSSGTAPITKPQLSSYKEIEKRMVSATKNYIFSEHDDLEVGDKLVINLKLLNDKDYIGLIYDVMDNKILCKGYINFERTNNNDVYIPYIKCGNNFITEGYKE